jgi:hypothetical protein
MERKDSKNSKKSKGSLLSFQRRRRVRIWQARYAGDRARQLTLL